MLEILLSILGGMILLYLGGESLVRGSSRLAARLGISPLIIGLTIVAYGTSFPELMVTAQSSWAGHGELAVGNVIGSNIFNLAVILGLSALFAPLAVNRQIIRVDIPFMIAISGLMLVFIQDAHVSRIEAGILFAGAIAYTLFNVILARKQRMELTVSLKITQKPSGNAVVDMFLIILGFILLTVGSHYMVEGAVALAKNLGVSEAVIGLTIVACGTSLPELATSIVAAIRKESEIALGNLVGSNIFNILAILGIAGLISPMDAVGITQVDKAVMMGVAVFLFPFAFTKGKSQRFAGLLFLIIYGGYLYLLWPK